jgi:hypothetical protein
MRPVSAAGSAQPGFQRQNKEVPSEKKGKSLGGKIMDTATESLLEYMPGAIAPFLAPAGPVLKDAVTKGKTDVKKIVKGGTKIASDVEEALDADEAAKVVKKTTDEVSDGLSGAERARRMMDEELDDRFIREDARRRLVEDRLTMSDAQINALQSVIGGDEKRDEQGFNRALTLMEAPSITRRLLDRGGLDNRTRQELAALGRAALAEYDLFEQGQTLDPQARSGASELDSGYGKGLISPMTGRIKYGDTAMREYYQDLADLEVSAQDDMSSPLARNTPVPNTIITPPKIQPSPIVPSVTPDNTVSQEQFSAGELVRESFTDTPEFAAELAAVPAASASQMMADARAEFPNTPMSELVPGPLDTPEFEAELAMVPPMTRNQQLQGAQDFPVASRAELGLPPMRRAAEGMLGQAARREIASPQMLSQMGAAGPGYADTYAAMNRESFQPFVEGPEPMVQFPSVAAPGVGRVPAPIGAMAPSAPVAPVSIGAEGISDAARQAAAMRLISNTPMQGEIEGQFLPAFIVRDQQGRLIDTRTGQIVGM